MVDVRDMFEQDAMTKQVLILNMTRIGDLVQTIPLIDRLHQEWPAVAIDLVVDRRCLEMAALVPGVRRVMPDELHRHLGKYPFADVNETQQLITAWAQPLKMEGYDRVINLNFTKRSGLMAAALGVKDTRGVTTTRDGRLLIRNPWFIYFVDLLHHRRFNRFNLVDLYALGGSGLSKSTPIRVSIPPSADEWANSFLATKSRGRSLVAVQVGASQGIKTWRPEYFGRAMAVLSRRMSVVFVLTGTDSETPMTKATLAAYHTAGGTASVHDAMGKTDLSQLASLLSRCVLLLTNDTSTLHLAVGVDTPTIDLSVGPTCFRETGPYGTGHWVIQPDLPCAPCSFTQVCAHHACKDEIVPEQVAGLAAHILGHQPFPSLWSGVQLYRSMIDEDGLVSYSQLAGRRDPISDWYGAFWRRFWYETLAEHPSRIAYETSAPSDLHEQQQRYRQLLPIMNRLVMQADQLSRMAESSMPASGQRPIHPSLAKDHEHLLALTSASTAFGPLTVALMRTLHNCEAFTARGQSQQRTHAYRIFQRRARIVMERLEPPHQVRKRRSSLVSLSQYKREDSCLQMIHYSFTGTSRKAEEQMHSSQQESSADHHDGKQHWAVLLNGLMLMIGVGIMNEPMSMV